MTSADALQTSTRKLRQPPSPEVQVLGLNSGTAHLDERRRVALRDRVRRVRAHRRQLQVPRAAGASGLIVRPDAHVGDCLANRLHGFIDPRVLHPAPCRVGLGPRV